MPSRIDNIIHYARVASGTLRDIARTSDVPFLSSVAGVSLLIFDTVQSFKANQERRMQLVEDIHRIMCAIIGVCFAAEGVLPPKILDNIGYFAETLQKIQSFLRAHQDLNKIRRFFQQSEINAQLDACEMRLQDILDTFSVHSVVNFTSTATEMKMDAEQRHRGLLKLLAQSGSQTSEESLSFQPMLLPLGNSSSALSILPARPKIFHGRHSELKALVATLLCDSPRVAILGPGGIGKTSLALAALHSSDIMAKYPHRHFVSCECANGDIGLMSAIISYLTIEPSRHPANDIFDYFSERDPTILVLDNFETPWEPLGSRAEVEDFLSLLTEIPNLALVITMRGAERPGQIKWTRPFLAPLQPLSDSATRQTFIDIADEPQVEEEDDVVKLIALTGKVPLAVSLMASVASLEGYSVALSRWSTESTKILSDGFDKKSNLEISITISIGSPRVDQSARQLLSLLSILPDGISDAELIQSHIPIDNLLRCKTTLLRTSLAYSAPDGRLKVLPPIREYTKAAHPPERPVVASLRKHMHSLLTLWKQRHRLPSGDLAQRLTSNLGNIRNLMLMGLSENETEVKDTIYSILALDDFSRYTLKGGCDLMNDLPALVDSIGDTGLWRSLSVSRISDENHTLTIAEVEELVNRDVEISETKADLSAKAIFYNAVAFYYGRAGDSRAEKFAHLALSVAEEIGDVSQQYAAIRTYCDLQIFTGSWAQASASARRAQCLAQLLGDFQAEAESLLREARAQCFLGRTSSGIGLCQHARKLLSQCGLEGSRTNIHILDTEADIHLQKTQYTESRDLNLEVARLTAPNRSPMFHANALTNLAMLGIFMGAPDEEICQYVDLARTVSARLRQWPHGLLCCDVAMALLYSLRGDHAKARTSHQRCITMSRGFSTELLSLSLENLANLEAGLSAVDEAYT
ncbi:hypothetical protein C8J57DRAFT_1719154 [Mycena rebaudengoi]|nr:hypothetical protein C8J57DRAFT_1719154 [Mycena rebaudengoi]